MTHTRRSQLCALAKDFAVRRFSPAGSSKATYILYYFIIFSHHKFDSLKISFAFPIIITRSFKNPHGLSMYIILSDWSIWIILSVRMQYHRGHYQLHHQQLREPADLQRQVLIRARFNTCSRLGEGGTGAAVLDAGCLSSTGEKDWQYCIPLLFLWSFARFSSFMSRFSKSNGHDVIPCRIIGFACRPNAKQIRQVSVCDDLSMLPLATAWRSAGHCPQWQRSCLQKFASEI